MKKFKKIITPLLVIVIVLNMSHVVNANKLAYSQGSIKVDKDETIHVWGDTKTMHRKSFGLIAKNVNTAKIESMSGGVMLLVTLKENKSRVLQIDPMKKKKKLLNNVFYTTYTVEKNVESIYPISTEAVFYRKKSGGIYYTGLGMCDLFFSHKSEKQCEKYCSKRVKNKKLVKNVTK